MNSSTNNNLTTLERIQLETKEAIQRENELKARYSTSNNFTLESQDEMENKVPIINQKKKHSFQKFTKNNGSTTSTTKGLMYRFIKSRGKLASTPFNNNNSDNHNSTIINWSNNNTDAAFGPIKFSIEKGSKSPRNGFVSAEEKMKKELQEFQERETELREERIKSQPNLMAALQLEDHQFNRFDKKNHHLQSIINIRNEDNNHLNCTGGLLKTAKSMANLYNNNNNNNSDDGFEDASSSTTGGSLNLLKPAKSLADLCDLSDEEIGLPGTQSLIMQFENMNFENRN